MGHSTDAIPSPEQIRSRDDLRSFVHATLCRRENLLPDQFPLSEAPLRRGGRACGVQFAIHGLRSVTLSAVWAAEPNIVYFYDARGQRFQKVALGHRVPLDAP